MFEKYKKLIPTHIAVMGNKYFLKEIGISKNEWKKMKMKMKKQQKEKRKEKNSLSESQRDKGKKMGKNYF